MTAGLLGAAEAGSRYLLARRTPAGMVFEDEIIYSYAPRARVGDTLLNDVGCLGDDVAEADPTSTQTVLLLGGSTSFSEGYVSGLREVLAAGRPNPALRVVSCGRPRYTSYLNRVNLEKNLLRHEPDVLVLYMGINDNIYNTFPWVSGVPDVGYFNWKSGRESVFWRLLKYHLLEKRLFSKPDFAGQPLRSTAIFESNVKGIVELARRQEMRVVLSTFAIAYPTEDRELLASIRSQEPVMEHFWGTLESTVAGVAAHNAVMRKLAAEHALPLAEVDGFIPRDGAHFGDLCHLTDRGNRLLAERIGAAILDHGLLAGSQPLPPLVRLRSLPGLPGNRCTTGTWALGLPGNRCTTGTWTSGLPGNRCTTGTWASGLPGNRPRTFLTVPEAFPHEIHGQCG